MTRDIFAQKLIQLREMKGISQQQLADAIGVTRQSLSLYEKGKRTIDIELLDKVATFFNVSTDYLLGRADVPFADPDDAAICKKLGIEGETLEALKYIFDDYFYSIKINDNELKSLSYASMFAQLFIRESRIGFYSQFAECAKAKALIKPLQEQYENTQAKIREINNGADITQTEYGVPVLHLSEQEVMEINALSSDSIKLSQEIYRRQKDIDGGEWGLFKSLLVILNSVSDRLDGDTWQA